jgi:hypothetical protein
MTTPEYFSWLKRDWAKVGPILAFYLTLFMAIFVRKTDFAAFLILLQTPLYMIHEAEEYIFPGGFGKFFNTDIFKIENEEGPLDESFVFFVNIGLIWMLLPLFGLLSVVSLKLGLWIPYFTLFAGIAHIALAIKARKLYNPGLIVSLMLNIPVGIAVIAYFARTGELANPLANIHLLIGLGLNLLLPVAGSIVYRKYMKRQQTGHMGEAL